MPHWGDRSLPQSSLRDASSLGEGALGKGFALQDGHEIDGRDGKQYDYCNDVGEDLFFVIHDDSFFLVGNGW